MDDGTSRSMTYNIVYIKTIKVTQNVLQYINKWTEINVDINKGS